ncbi:MAG: ribosome silencing factor [Candidatus Omnitrophica bacterium]|nr:ribosome silencing factor [Candidatus Omnitrophota bacterium]MBU0878740.1 ribosome silencing factor [Candidatus Omnitrophota bacterium]MBU0896610.1 ribosome silencing factor [Candidatus Omnitrophota bacterium]MBU1133926.1 ribosome silencing factor [Candidatus Omnitrophota bacterium]MBU1810127.1 ribosome silencing factor [Candidatus Omnitrophota bacterium]
MNASSSEVKAKVLKLLEFVLEKQANEPVILDVRKTGLSDYFIICSAPSEEQVRAIYNQVLKQCKKNKIKIYHRQDDELSCWVLLDFFDVILHVFTDEARYFYNLEYLWQPAIKMSSIPPAPKKSSKT